MTTPSETPAPASSNSQDAEGWTPSPELRAQHRHAMSEGNDADRATFAKARDAEKAAWEAANPRTSTHTSASPSSGSGPSAGPSDGGPPQVTPDPYKYSRVGQPPLYYGPGNPNNERNADGSLTSLGMGRANDRGWNLPPGALPVGPGGPELTSSDAQEAAAGALFSEFKTELDRINDLTAGERITALERLAATYGGKLDVLDAGIKVDAGTWSTGERDKLQEHADDGKAYTKAVEDFNTELTKIWGLPLGEQAAALIVLGEKHSDLSVVSKDTGKTTTVPDYLASEIERVQESRRAHVANDNAVAGLNAVIAEANELPAPEKAKALEAAATKFEGLEVETEDGRKVSAKTYLIEAAANTRRNHEATVAEAEQDHLAYRDNSLDALTSVISAANALPDPEKAKALEAAAPKFKGLTVQAADGRTMNASAYLIEAAANTRRNHEATVAEAEQDHLTYRDNSLDGLTSVISAANALPDPEKAKALEAAAPKFKGLTVQAADGRTMNASAYLIEAAANTRRNHEATVAEAEQDHMPRGAISHEGSKVAPNSNDRSWSLNVNPNHPQYAASQHYDAMGHTVPPAEVAKSYSELQAAGEALAAVQDSPRIATGVTSEGRHKALTQTHSAMDAATSRYNEAEAKYLQAIGYTPLQEAIAEATERLTTLKQPSASATGRRHS